MTTASISLERLQRITYEVDIQGITPLIVHRFSESAMQAIVDKNMGKTARTRAPKDPVLVDFDQLLRDDLDQRGEGVA